MSTHAFSFPLPAPPDPRAQHGDDPTDVGLGEPSVDEVDAAEPARAVASPFDERETISVPASMFPEEALPRREAIVALRVVAAPTDGEPRRGVELRDAPASDVPLPRDVETFTIGSVPGCDLVLFDRYVSARHCVLERRGPARWLVFDAGSKNGTFLNGGRVEIAELRAGSRLTLGMTTVVLLGERAAAGRSPTGALALLKGDDFGFRSSVDLALRAAASSCSVLLLGETGTGKELFARVIHEASPRAHGPFVAVNCGAIPRDLAESELFGHERGAFTGATTDRDGVFVQADGGTLFLDEIGELPVHQQPQLLRVLESRVVRRVGASRERPVDVRVVAATNRMAVPDVADSPLRADLYHRLAGVVVPLPALRERRGDVAILVRAFMDELARDHGPRVMSQAAMRALIDHSWPGNVRELRQAVQRAFTLCAYELTVDTLLPPRPSPSRPRRDGGLRPPARSPEASGIDDEAPTYDQVVRDMIARALERYGSIRRAARALNMSKSTLADRAHRYGLLVKR